MSFQYIGISCNVHEASDIAGCGLAHGGYSLGTLRSLIWTVQIRCSSPAGILLGLASSIGKTAKSH